MSEQKQRPIGKRQAAFLAAMGGAGAQVWTNGATHTVTNRSVSNTSAVAKIGRKGLAGLIKRGLVKVTSDGFTKA
jgi:hypothetical protein